MSESLNLSGRKFGKLTAIQVDKSETGRRKWICLCECGNLTSVSTNQLTSGKTKSCGCLKYETKNQTHGLKKTRIYGIWCGMKKRCNNPNDKNYKNYGARAIKVCDEWQDDFVSFYSWSLLNGYAENLTIDRIDNEKGYYPENCRWITHAEQQSNRRNNVTITIDGETKTVSKWSIETGLPEKKIYERYARLKSRKIEITKDNLFCENLCKKKILQFDLSGKFLAMWDSATEAEKKGYSRSAINQCCRGKLKTHSGCIWKYAGD